MVCGFRGQLASHWLRYPVGSGLLTFDGNGNFISATKTTVAIDRSGLPSVSPLQFDIDFSKVSGLATADASLAASRQDGSPPVH